MSYRRIILLLVILILFSCQSRTGFDTRRAGYDYIRIPFIKPYEAIQLNNMAEWRMNFFKETLSSSAVNIKRVNVINQIILLYCQQANLNGIKVDQAWFVIVPAQHIEQGFSNHGDYIDFLKKIGVIVEPKLYDINSISKYFNDHFPINWGELNRDNQLGNSGSNIIQ
jgi:hypothetical protein